jgi:hypothetical protein
LLFAAASVLWGISFRGRLANLLQKDGAGQSSIRSWLRRVPLRDRTVILVSG